MSNSFLSNALPLSIFEDRKKKEIENNSLRAHFLHPFMRSMMSFVRSFLFRHALDIREHYERKLERTNNLYMELNAVMLQLELKEKELQK